MSNLKYKVGDKVKIKSFDWFRNGACNGFNAFMPKYCGEVFTIKSKNETLQVYYMIEDGGTNAWTDEMIEGLVEEEKKLSDESWRYKNIFDHSQYSQSFKLPEGYIFKDENGNIINATKIVLEKKTVEEKYSDVKIQIFGNVVILKGGIDADNPTEYMNEVVDYILNLLGKPKYNQFIEDYLDNPWVRILIFDFNSMEFNNSFDDIVNKFN